MVYQRVFDSLMYKITIRNQSLMSVRHMGEYNGNTLTFMQLPKRMTTHRPVSWIVISVHHTLPLHMGLIAISSTPPTPLPTSMDLFSPPSSQFVGEQYIFSREDDTLHMGTTDEWIQSFLGTARYIFKDDYRFKSCITVLDRSRNDLLWFPKWVIHDKCIFKPATPGELL